jgi:hypothetical protein
MPKLILAPSPRHRPFLSRQARSVGSIASHGTRTSTRPSLAGMEGNRTDRPSPRVANASRTALTGSSQIKPFTHAALGFLGLLRLGREWSPRADRRQERDSGLNS